ncbi:hypothetical protein [Hyalangium minutum]|uniref:Uncharacterized protein n=1 Tax=Hyalangium minutum TaxID=394096 RepID=A0A085WN66_9BACT|nr:hypothetical protein [Hyalangium minutum]KFE69129.1 hypothetical protein DB31_7031 [Hyalangium minutum]
MHSWSHGWLTQHGFLALILLAVSLLSACATTHSATGWAGGELRLEAHSFSHSEEEDVRFARDVPFPPLRESERAEATRAEIQRALNEMWTVTSHSDAPGAHWEFRYWVDGGALTLLSFHRVKEGGGRAAPVDRSAFLAGLEHHLTTLLGTEARQVTLSLEREEARWTLDLDLSARTEAPWHARTLPSSQEGTSRASYAQVLTTARGLQRLMALPRNGTTRLEVRLTLEDDRISSWELSRRDASGSGTDMPASEAEVTLVTHALRPFLKGLGEREVVLILHGRHSPGAPLPRWEATEARTLEPPPPPRELEDFRREYLAMHERILRESREEMRDGVVFLAGFSIEQVATMLVGGFILKRALILFEAAAPTVTSLLARGGHGAVRWFRNLLVRMPAAERQALQQLWLKAETQGLKALSEAEKTQLRGLMGRLEGLLRTSLDDQAKKQLRVWARTEYFELHRPELAKALGTVRLQAYDIHHTCPLEYAHLFPKLDINGGANLIGLYRDVHRSIGKVWSLARPVAEKMTARDVTRMMDIVHRHYRRWFHQMYDPSSAPTLARAEQAALAEAAEFLATLTR